MISLLAMVVLQTSAPPLAPVDSLERAYIQACYAGVVQTQKALPKVPQQDDLLRRGYLSCDGSLSRMKRTGQFAREPLMGELGCGYAVGAMLAKYGLADELNPPSARALQAMEACQTALRRQGIE